MRESLPDAHESFEAIVRELGSWVPAIFLDFDGTLAPIVERPERAGMSPEMREAVARVAEHFPVAVVSGRDLSDIRRRVGLEKVAYAGSHGFDIRTSDGESIQPGKVEKFIPALSAAEEECREVLADVDGVQVERKRYSLAIHYRRVSSVDVERVEASVERILAACDGLELTRGKQVFDLQPDIDWDKGRAVDVLLETLGTDESEAVPLYLGDDVTDENAFRALVDEGISMIVDPGDRPTVADYALGSPAEVRRFLERLADRPEAFRNPDL